MKREDCKRQKEGAIAYYEKSGIVLTEQEKENIEVIDLNLGKVREIGLQLRQALADILPYAIIAATVMAVSYYSTRFVENIYIRLPSKIMLAAALYIAAMWTSRSVTFKESIAYFIKKKTDGHE